MKRNADSEERSDYENSQVLAHKNLDSSSEMKSYTGTPDLLSNKTRNDSFARTVDYFWKSQYQNIKWSTITNNSDLMMSKDNICFGKNETTVYMTLFENITPRKSTGTQATGSINKCLQFNINKINSTARWLSFNDKRSSTNLLYLNNRTGIPYNIRNPSIYFFDKKKSGKGKLNKGMGSQESALKSDAYKNTPTTAYTQASATKTSVSMQTKTSGSNSGFNTGKSVTIKSNALKPCPAIGAVRGDMMATVSHIKIAPKQPCPVHGKDPCQGPRCIAARAQEEQGPVKVSSVNNPRRGVFELVIRKMTGAPLAKNELMLEWTPPPCRQPSCSATSPCPLSMHKPPSCRQSKYKMIMCRPSPCRPKCSNKIYKRSCSAMPVPICPSLPCKTCCKTSCCGKPCLKTTPTCSPTIPCTPDIPSPCVSPCSPPSCSKNPCRTPCVSSPCLRPCPIGRKRTKRARSHPRIKAHPKRVSPCLNKAKVCPAVRCKSILMPCVKCCYLKACYLPTICSATPCKPLTSCRSYSSVECG